MDLITQGALSSDISLFFVCSAGQCTGSIYSKKFYHVQRWVEIHGH